MDEATGMIAGPGSVHAAPAPAATAPGSSAEEHPDPTTGGRDATADHAAADTNGPAPAADADGAAGAPDAAAASQEPGQAGVSMSPGFRERGRMRRRLAFLRRARELAYRDLGGLVFNLHRFGQRHDDLVLAKLSVLQRLDDEQRALESALAERRAPTVLRVPGITACPRCAAIHASEDRFCPNCGLPMGRRADLPIAGPAQDAAQPAGPQPPSDFVADRTASHAASHASGAPGETPSSPQGAPGAAPSSAQGAPRVSDPASAMDEATEILRPPPDGR